MTVLELERPVEILAVSVEETPTLSTTRTALAGGLAAAGAGVVVGGMFDGQLGRVVGGLAAVLAAGLVGLAISRGRAWMQYLVAPAVFVSGYVAALVLPNPTGITGTVPELVRKAIANGGLSHPPIPFDPGWRFLLVAIVGLVAAAGVSLACGFRSPRLAVIAPVPLLLAGSLNQPAGRELISGVLGLGLTLAALSVSFGAELAGNAEMSRSFELRQLAKSLAATVVCLAGLVALSQASFLFPASPPSRDAAPQKPKIVPLSKVRDRPLFELTGSSPGPYRVGVLDSYDHDGWYLPPFDPNRYLTPAHDGSVAAPAVGPQVVISFTVRDLDGFTLPTTPTATKVVTTGRVQYDPRVGTFRTRDGAPPAGFSYAVTSSQSPTGDQLETATNKPLDAAAAGYLSVPPMPLEVQRLLAKAPRNRWERLQTLRSKLYENVIAAGSGQPVDVPPAKVVAMLAGAKATPFEIVAGEAMLARWAGVPSRIGYGYYGGAKHGLGLEFRPRDGANWLEVLLADRGWVPIVGTPRRAAASLDAVVSNRPQVLPSNQITLRIFAPVLNRDPELLFEVIRFYALRAGLLLAAIFALWRSLPVAARALRRRRRRAWAAVHGPAGRVAVAYADFRDTARDLGLDDGTCTPLEFLDEVVEDAEHAELAWLTTRALWGDLSRGLEDVDAEAGEQLASSLRTRLARGQGGLVRFSALLSKASLRAPYDAGLPNAWPARRRRQWTEVLATQARRLPLLPALARRTA